MLLDFGIVKLLSSDVPQATDYAVSRGGPLTPDYASPEQLGGQRRHCFGYLFARRRAARAVVGSRAFSGSRSRGSRGRSSRAILRGRASSPRRLVAAARRTPRRLAQTLKGDLDTIVLKALKKARPSAIFGLRQDIASSW